MGCDVLIKRENFHEIGTFFVEIITFLEHNIGSNDTDQELFMRRDLYQDLLAWKDNPYRKPLVLNGARQVGKTYLLKAFGQEFPHCLHLNFEERPQVAQFFSEDLDPVRILKHLSLYSQLPLEEGKTLIIWDEVQVCPEAITSLKYFQEKRPEIPIIAAGSLLGVKLKRDKISFPVGKVDFLDLFPLNFFEFLEALGKEKLRRHLESEPLEALPPPLHQELLTDLKHYFVVGGMPEVVERFKTTGSLQDVRPLQRDILHSYTLDFAKYAPPHEVLKIMKVWESIPGQLARENKKFIFSAIEKSARAREMLTALHWLKDAGLIYFCHCVETPRLPLMSYSNPSCFKVYLLDIGLLGALSSLPEQVILEGSRLFTEFKGALTENYVANALVLSQGRDHLYYWASPGKAEVDFLLPTGDSVVPLEVKSGTTAHIKSLLVYQERYAPSSSTVTSLAPYSLKGHLCNLPLYLIQRLRCS